MPDDDQSGEEDNVYALMLETKAALQTAESEWISNPPMRSVIARVRANLARVPALLQQTLAEIDRVEHKMKGGTDA